MNTGKFSLATSLSSILAGMSLNDIAQLAAFIVGIISGLMAIRYYWVGTKLQYLQIEQREEAIREFKTESDN
ncbi:hypothetical protein [Vibrio galatheae]|uniref:hypothetical protein n=1 Tax=Vibrio galatheae TaxID=579748 RepID=UPI0005FA5E30|nr:hypothetical protein [Vibrio galatheae]